MHYIPPLDPPNTAYERLLANFQDRTLPIAPSAPPTTAPSDTPRPEHVTYYYSTPPPHAAGIPPVAPPGIQSPLLHPLTARHLPFLLSPISDLSPHPALLPLLVKLGIHLQGIRDDAKDKQAEVEKWAGHIFARVYEARFRCERCITANKKCYYTTLGGPSSIYPGSVHRKPCVRCTIDARSALDEGSSEPLAICSFYSKVLGTPYYNLQPCVNWLAKIEPWTQAQLDDLFLSLRIDITQSQVTTNRPRRRLKRRPALRDDATSDIVAPKAGVKIRRTKDSGKDREHAVPAAAIGTDGADREGPAQEAAGVSEVRRKHDKADSANPAHRMVPSVAREQVTAQGNTLLRPPSASTRITIPLFIEPPFSFAPRLPRANQAVEATSAILESLTEDMHSSFSTATFSDADLRPNYLLHLTGYSINSHPHERAIPPAAEDAETMAEDAYIRLALSSIPVHAPEFASLWSPAWKYLQSSVPSLRKAGSTTGTYLFHRDDIDLDDLLAHFEHDGGPEGLLQPEDFAAGVGKYDLDKWQSAPYDVSMMTTILDRFRSMIDPLFLQNVLIRSAPGMPTVAEIEDTQTTFVLGYDTVPQPERSGSENDHAVRNGLAFAYLLDKSRPTPRKLLKVLSVNLLDLSYLWTRLNSLHPRSQWQIVPVFRHWPGDPGSVPSAQVSMLLVYVIEIMSAQLLKHFRQVEPAGGGRGQEVTTTWFADLSTSPDVQNTTRRRYLRILIEDYQWRDQVRQTLRDGARLSGPASHIN